MSYSSNSTISGCTPCDFGYWSDGGNPSTCVQIPCPSNGIYANVAGQVLIYIFSLLTTSTVISLLSS